MQMNNSVLKCQEVTCQLTFDQDRFCYIQYSEKLNSLPLRHQANTQEMCVQLHCQGTAHFFLRFYRMIRVKSSSVPLLPTSNIILHLFLISSQSSIFSLSGRIHQRNSKHITQGYLLTTCHSILECSYYPDMSSTQGQMVVGERQPEYCSCIKNSNFSDCT